MNPDQRQHSPRPTQRLWPLAWALSLGLVSLSVLAEVPDQQDGIETAPWYQVEVVIFTQQGFIGNEQPPRQYQLDFPGNVLELRDTDYIGNNYPIPDYEAQLALDANLQGQRAIPVVTVEDPAISFLNTALGSVVSEEPASIMPVAVAIPLRDTASENQVLTETVTEQQAEALAEPEAEEEEYIPLYEKPFIKLDRELRDLNDSARALDRRSKYNVVFHEAWRFAADSASNDPWVIIKAGKQHQDRFEIEGSLRFYKSRFLHFQSDLWLLNFAGSDGEAETVQLPAFPEVPEPSLSEGQEALEIAVDEAALERFFFGEPEVPADADRGEEELSSPQPAGYRIANLWTFDQSKRLEEEQSYYLDHPKMGVLVTIKSHQVEITNPLEETPEEEETEILESASVNLAE